MTSATLTVIPSVWEATLDALAPYHARQVEGGCLWYGRRDAEGTRAVLVGIPKQVNRPRNFEIPANALAELNARVPEDLVVVAQVHSHPGQCTRHSPWDDGLVVSRKIFSLVVPRYAARPCELASAGVHSFDGMCWVKLAPEEASRRLLLEHGGAFPVAVAVVDTR